VRPPSAGATLRRRSGETDTVYTKDFGKLGKEYASALIKQLKKGKVIGKK
jgi:hypothetical protein